MTYRKHNQCSYLSCPLKRLYRAIRWHLISQPLSYTLDVVREGPAIYKHFGSKY